MMWSILAQMWLCLLIAALIGFVVAWFLRKRRTPHTNEQSAAELAFKLRQRDEELAAARAENTIHTSTLDILRNEIAVLTKRLASLETGGTGHDPGKKKQGRTGNAIERGSTLAHREKNRKRTNGGTQKDDLKLIVGIGPVLERRLNKLGVSTFKQIAQWDKDDVERFSERLQSFGDRIAREHWVSAARKLHKQKYGETL
jgi:predicted flap endonuclease-1-like 5' DNA nuclease